MTESTLLNATEANQPPEGQATNTAQGLEPNAAQQQQQEKSAQGDAGKPAEGQPKPAEQKPGEQAKPKEGEQAKAEGAPEAYDFKAPEGAQVDQSVLDTWKDVARELNLPQDKAQMVLDKMMPRIHERTIENHRAEVERWAETSRELKELNSGDGFDANVKIANAAIAKFGSEGLQQLLTGPLGLGNHPELVAFAYRVGKALQPDGFVAGGRTGSAGDPMPTDDASMAKRLYREQS